MPSAKTTKNTIDGPRRQKATVVKGKNKTFVRQQWVGSDKEQEAPRRRGRPRKNPEEQTTTQTSAKTNKRNNIIDLADDTADYKSPVSGMKAIDINKLKGLPVNSRQMAVIDPSKVNPKLLMNAIKKKKAVIVDVDEKMKTIPVFAVTEKSGYTMGASRFAVATSEDDYLFGEFDYEKVGEIENTTGQIVLGDPENFFDDKFHPHEKATGGFFDEACRIALNKKEHFGSFADNSGFTFSTIYGEGNCPIFAKGNNTGKIDSISVVFEEDPFDIDEAEDEFGDMYGGLEDIDDFYDDF